MNEYHLGKKIEERSLLASANGTPALSTSISLSVNFVEGNSEE